MAQGDTMTTVTTGPDAANENARLSALRDFDQLDAQYGATFERYARLACAITGADGAAIRLWPEAPGRLLGAHGETVGQRADRTPTLRHDEPVCDAEGLRIGTLQVVHSAPRGLTRGQTALLGELAGSVATALALYRSMRDICRLATTDCLTEAGNRTWFLHQLRAEAARSRRGQTPVSVVYCDCDGFKMVNNTLGHAAGDELLREISAAIRAHLRVSDTFGRLGGDEFAIILPETGPAAASAIAERIRMACRAFTARYSHPVSVSFGVATYPCAPETVEEMIEAADAAMYEAKRGGRDRVVSKVIRAGARLTVIDSRGQARLA